MKLPRPGVLQRRPWLVPVAGATALLLVVASHWVGPWAPPTLLVASPQRLQLDLALVGIGRVEARRSHQLSSVVAARLVSLTVDSGDPVAAGQQLGQLDPVDLPERLQAARAALQASRQQTSAAQARVDEAQASLTYVRSNTARFERLALLGTVSEDALLERRQAAAGLAGVQAQQQTLRLVAPTAGIVTRRLVDPGSTVVPGQPVLEIADPAQFWIDVRFDQRQAAGLAPSLGELVEVLAGLDPGAKVLLQPPSDPGALRRYRLKEAQP